MYELRLGQPFQHNSMPEMRATFANAGELCQQSGHFYFKRRSWRSYTQTDSIEMSALMKKNAEKLWCFPQQMKKRIILLLYSQL